MGRTKGTPMYSDVDLKIQVVADMINESKKTVVFTGAGVSTESGIPDFRSSGGIWSRFDPDDFSIHKFLHSADTRKRQWKLLIGEGYFTDREPNMAHYAIAKLEHLGRLDCVITQNIDNLHQRAGNSPDKVIELHGNINRVRCLDCRSFLPIEYVKQALKDGIEEPPCRKCFGTLKPDVVFFGEEIPEHAMGAATFHSSECDLFIVVGSSLIVQPASFMPMYAKDGGAKLVIINIGGTPLDKQADIIINGRAGDIMTRIVDIVRNDMEASSTRE
jgi:NAD-dependent deacetylase